MADRTPAAKRRLMAIAIAVALLAPVNGARAVQPDEMLSDPVLEARAREIGKELRCLVCQNESIDESNADLARDLRRLVRERLTEGDSNEQVLAFVVSRYGDYVLLRPPLKPATWALWFGPAVFLLAGAGALVLFFRRRSMPAAVAPAADAPITSEDERRLQRALEESGEGTNPGRENGAGSRAS